MCGDETVLAATAKGEQVHIADASLPGCVPGRPQRCHRYGRVRVVMLPTPLREDTQYHAAPEGGHLGREVDVPLPQVESLRSQIHTLTHFEQCDVEQRTLPGGLSDRGPQRVQIDIGVARGCLKRVSADAPMCAYAALLVNDVVQT